MSPNPPDFITHLRIQGYHPRSNAHSNALALCIVRDLFAYCRGIREDAIAGSLVYDLNFTLRSGTADWNVDLVLGEPPIGPAAALRADGAMARVRPSTVLVAVEIKGVMTEHRKAVRNRKRDLEAHHDHVHRYKADAIAAGVLVINGSRTFRSPLRAGRTEHRDPTELVRHCLSQLRAVSVRSKVGETGLDAKAAIVVDMDNENLPGTKYLTAPPAPQVGDPMHYDAFIQTICSQYEARFWKKG